MVFCNNQGINLWQLLITFLIVKYLPLKNCWRFNDSSSYLLGSCYAISGRYPVLTTRKLVFYFFHIWLYFLRCCIIVKVFYKCSFITNNILSYTFSTKLTKWLYFLWWSLSINKPIWLRLFLIQGTFTDE